MYLRHRNRKLINALRCTFIASPSQSRDSFIFPSNTISDGTPETISRTAPHPSLKHLHHFPSSFVPSSPNTNRGSPRFSLVSEQDMDVDEDLSASTYTFESSPTGRSASATPGSGAFTPRGVGHTTLGPPSALSILLAHKQESKGSKELLGGEQTSSATGYDGARTLEYPTSQSSVTPTNDFPGDAYFSLAADTPRRLGPRLTTELHTAAPVEEVEPELPDQSQRMPNETTSLLRADHTNFHHEDANNSSRPMFVVTKTQPKHVKPVTPSDYGSITFLSKPYETFRHNLDPNLGRKALRAIPAVVLGTLLNVLDGISCTCSPFMMVAPRCPAFTGSGYATRKPYIRRHVRVTSS